MVNLKFELLAKQTEAWEYFEDEKTEQLGYGGAAGGGKTVLGCFLCIYVAIAYPGSRIGIGRKELKNLKRTTLASFFEVAQKQGLRDKVDFNYNQQESMISFTNGSEIILFDTAYQPADPEYTRFGSYELSFLWIDESNESPEKSISILQTRVGRKNKTDMWDLKPFTLETFNPNKGHVYQRYYAPYKAKQLPEYRKFIPALVTDNPFLPPAYIENLKRSDTITRERLLFGNFDYDENKMQLINYDSLLNVFSNNYVEPGTKYITADIAMQGSDKMVICVWEGLRLIKIYSENKSTGKGIEEKIKALSTEYQIGQSNIVFDNDGVGSFLGSYLENAKPFVNNSSPLNNENYKNLKTQCYYKLADYINNGKIFIADKEHKSEIIEELEQIRQKNADSDGKLEIESKDEIKRELKRSPDFADAIMMRMFFELKPNYDWLKITFNVPSLYE